MKENKWNKPIDQYEREKVLDRYDEDLMKYAHIQRQLRRDTLVFKDVQAKWIYKLYKSTNKGDFEISPEEEDQLLRIIKSLVGDDIDCIRRKTIQTIANICCVSKTFPIKVLEEGILKQLLQKFLTSGAESRRAVLSIVGSYCRVCQPTEIDKILNLKLIDFLIACLTSVDDAMITGAVDATFHMVRHPVIIQSLITKGLLRNVALLLVDDMHGNKPRTKLLMAFLRQHSELFSPIQASTIRNSGCLAAAARYLYCDDPVLQKLAFGIIMNIGVIRVEYIIPLFSPDFMSDIVSLLIVDDVEMRYYAAVIIKYAVDSSKLRLRVLLENGVMEALLLAVQKLKYCADEPLQALERVIKRSPDASVERFFRVEGNLILAELLYHDCCTLIIMTILKIFIGINRRGPPLSTAIANTPFYSRLTELYKEPSTSPMVRSVITSAMEIIRSASEESVVKNFFYGSLLKHAKFAIRHFNRALAASPSERKSFMEFGGLTRVQEMRLPSDDPMYEDVKNIKSFYPQEVINYYSPGFVYSQFQKLDKYDPQEAIKNFYRRQILQRKFQESSNVI